MHCVHLSIDNNMASTRTLPRLLHFYAKTKGYRSSSSRLKKPMLLGLCTSEVVNNKNDQTFFSLLPIRPLQLSLQIVFRFSESRMKTYKQDKFQARALQPHHFARSVWDQVANWANICSKSAAGLQSKLKWGQLSEQTFTFIHSWRFEWWLNVSQIFHVSRTNAVTCLEKVLKNKITTMQKNFSSYHLLLFVIMSCRWFKALNETSHERTGSVFKKSKRNVCTVNFALSTAL